MKREVAILVSAMYADIEIARADYQNALRWLNSIEEFDSQPGMEVAPFIRYQINEKKAQIFRSRGELPEAEAGSWTTSPASARSRNLTPGSTIST